MSTIYYYSLILLIHCLNSSGFSLKKLHKFQPASSGTVRLYTLPIFGSARPPLLGITRSFRKSVNLGAFLRSVQVWLKKTWLCSNQERKYPFSNRLFSLRQTRRIVKCRPHMKTSWRCWCGMKRTPLQHTGTIWSTVPPNRTGIGSPGWNCMKACVVQNWWSTK